MTIGIPAIIALAALFISFVGYVASVQYRLGKQEAKVDNLEKDVDQLHMSSATKSDMDGIKLQLAEIKSSIDKLFDLDRERSQK